MDKKSARQIIESRKLVSGVGKFTLKVATVSLPQFNEDKGVVTNIVNFAAMTPWQLNEATSAYREGVSLENQGDTKGAEELYQKATNYALTSSVLEGRYLPAKGEIVDVEIGEMVNKEGLKILVVEAIVARKATAAASIKLIDDTEETEETGNEENTENVEASKTVAEEEIV